MRVTFIYTDHGRFNSKNINMGVAILSSCLKQCGYDVSLIHISSPITEDSFISLIRKHKPDIFAVSFISNMFSQIKRFAGWLNENFSHVPTIYGGLHPTVAPEECLSVDGIKVICRGEGEGALIDFCEAIKNNGSVKDIPNLWIKEGEHIYRNSCRNLIENLDSLPFHDYELFEYEKLEESMVHQVMITQASRGCHYSCTYCCNHALRTLYPNPGNYVRFYSVDRILDEIEYFLKKYPFLKSVRFNDDTLTHNKKWFEEFAKKYKERINLPYSGNDRVENITPEIAELLRHSGCVSLDLGIENGDERIRKEFMKRYNTNDRIINAFKLLNSHGIATNAFNIIGMVGETPQTILKTTKLNAIVNPTITFNAYFYPFKGTDAYRMCKEKGYYIEEDIGSFFEKPSVTLDTVKREQLIFFYRYFRILMKVYRIVLKSSGEETKTVNSLDKILTSKYFPYAFLSFIHFGKEDMIAILRKNFRFYVFIRKIYRLIKKVL